MKGIVFTEFLEMVEDKFSPEIADRIIEASSLPSGGAYTTLGRYDYHEIMQLMTRLSQETGIELPEMLQAFGQHLLGQFAQGYPQFFAGIDSTFTFLENVHKYIHVEVEKLYKDVELPNFEYEKEPGKLVMTYRSVRPFPDLAHGLIMGSIEQFGEAIDVQREDLPVEQGTAARFTLTIREQP